jgi:hypothetical protein
MAMAMTAARRTVIMEPTETILMRLHLLPRSDGGARLASWVIRRSVGVNELVVD